LDWWEKYVTGSGIPSLSIQVAHLLRLGSLPDFHRDPFDRIPMAQAMVEKLTLVTKDSAREKYGAAIAS
jgi:PIN domain nuclease of toxin-antitoxin system